MAKYKRLARRTPKRSKRPPIHERKLRPPHRPQKKKYADSADKASQALALMIQDGLSERQAAKAVGISRSTLRSFRKRNTKSSFRNGHWRIADKRPQLMYIASGGRLVAIAATGRTASAIGRYWNAVNAYLDTNRRSFLRRFDGVRVRDYGGKYHVLETDPSVLRKLDAIGDFDFKEIYAQGSVGGGHG